jgi:hypothetical protein
VVAVTIQGSDRPRIPLVDCNEATVLVLSRSMSACVKEHVSARCSSCWYGRSSFCLICSVRNMTSLTCRQISNALFSAFVPLSFQRGVSRTGSNCLKSPRKITIGRPPRMAELPGGGDQILEHLSSVRTSILQPTMLTSSMRGTWFEQAVS